MSQLQFSVDAYREAVAYYEKTWRVMDQVLYRLCRENPGHRHPSSVHSKLWIVGRTYATGIERKIATTGAQGSSMSQVADHFLAHHARIDEIFGELRSLDEPLNAVNLCTVVSLHGKLVTLLCPITRRGQSTRSFVSKYMHFHNPAVPIYDSVANTSLRRIVRWNGELATFKMPVDADKEYGWFVMRFLRLYREAASNGLPATVRHVDHYLLSRAGSEYTDATKPELIGVP